MLEILFWNLFMFVAGGVTVLLSAWWWIANQEKPNLEQERPTITNTVLPNVLIDKLKQGLHRRETCFALNLVLQFFFQEKRYEAGIIRWLTNMLTLEFNDLLRHKTLSKFIHNMQIRDLNLGTNFPVIRAVTAKHVNLNPDSSNLEQIDILVELEYNGGIQLAVDASSRFSKSAMVKIKVVQLSGNGRLQFSRYPFTHWSFSFYEEPRVEFEVYSSLGLHIPRFNAIIISQLRGVLKRKHTLPYFKLRGPPLVKRPQHPANEEGCSVPPGRLTGEVVRCSRLQSSLVDEIMFCTVMLSEVPIICAVEKPAGMYIVQDITLKRPHGASAGILLHNAEEGTQMVESVQQSSPAYAAGLRKNDVLLAVNGTYLSSSQQAAKLFSSSSISGDVDNITLRVKRIIPLDQRKMVAEQKPICSDGASSVIGEETTGRLHVASSNQTVVALSTINMSSYTGDKSLSARLDSSASSTPGCGYPSINQNARSAGAGGGGRGGASHSSVVGSSSHGGRVDADVNNATSIVGCDGFSNVDVGNSSGDGGGGVVGTRGVDNHSTSCIGSIGTGPVTSSTIGGSDDDVVHGTSRAVSPSHLLAGIMGSFNGGRPAKHRSLPGSPVLQRTNRTRVNSTREGDVSGSGRSTPDSSHNSSPELKRKLLELHTLSTDPKPSALNQDRSPIAPNTNRGVSRSVLNSSQDKSSGPINVSQSYSASSEKPSSNQSSKAGTPTSPEIIIPQQMERRPGRRHGSKFKPHIKMVQTPPVEGNTDPIFNSDFEFWLEEENKYLNVAVWSKSGSSKQDCEVDYAEKNVESKFILRDRDRDKRRIKETEKAKFKEDKVVADLTDDTLVGYVNIPIISLIPETTLNTQGHAVRILTLKPPHPKCPEVMCDPLTPHKGFDMNLCYGDVMLSLTYQPQDRCDVSMRVNQDKVSNRPISEDESLTDGTVSEEDEMYGMQDIVEDRIHDFKRTHFNSAVQCNFCRKKIWLKDAYQCGECGIVCHKKCMVRCGDETICDISGLRYRDASKNDSQEPVETKETPEIITTVASGSGGDNGSPGNTPPVSPHSQRRTLSSLFAQVASASKGSLKRAGSANNLAPPNSSHDGTHSRSLPPSPPHSPQQSRKASISEGTNPFVVDFGEGDSIESVLDRLLLYPHDENLVTLARESAKDLYSALSGEERREKIDSTLMLLQEVVDREGEFRVDLARQERDASDAGDALTRSSVALQISQCDARTQALALLTLHYCTALQYCSEEALVTDANPEASQ
ncbi:PDZ domain-containing protein 8-like isoform X1 [Palaemon carinicauda]|uniref:PDZ domain-containing protein 8-like isoform X1 n=1 Tax=Palaemon carinicauda TaxID=392227 RepID=UPI0035B5E5FF